jgi:hypothetical protein
MNFLEIAYGIDVEFCLAFLGRLARCVGRLIAFVAQYDDTQISHQRCCWSLRREREEHIYLA